MLKTFQRLKAAMTPEILPAVARAESSLERGDPGRPDPGATAVIEACVDWLCTAQDRSASADGGIARDYSLITGWSTSYPETTGYIIPTMIDVATRQGREDLHQRARKMLDWCVDIQFDSGAFQGGKIDASPFVPVTFNTGQILLGLAAGAAAYGDARYRRAMQAAADWLRETQDADGCWRRFPTPFAAPGEKAYETHVAWGLFEADRVEPGQGWAQAGLRQIDWALTRQQANGWFASKCLANPALPLTHTIGYVLRGLIEGQRLSGRPDLLAAARRTADGLLPAIDESGRLAGHLDHLWRPASDYVCLTGSAQIGHCLLLLYGITGNARYRDAGLRLNAYVRKTVRLEGPAGIRGGVKGSFPMAGGYGRFQYLNWAAKFCIDANLLECDIGCLGAGAARISDDAKPARTTGPSHAIG